jgi:hypothetical protein
LGFFFLAIIAVLIYTISRAGAVAKLRRAAVFYHVGGSRVTGRPSRPAHHQDFDLSYAAAVYLIIFISGVNSRKLLFGFLYGRGVESNSLHTIIIG